jgi:hypothetical protein
MGRNLKDSFVAARQFFSVWTGFNQKPWLDDDSDGIYYKDGAYARTLHWGYPWAFAGPEGGELPFVLDAGPRDTVIPGAQTVLWARLMEGPVPTRVTATIIPPTVAYAPGQAITGFPMVALAREGQTWRWSATAGGFTQAGTYTVLFQALYANDRLSLPVLIHVGPTPAAVAFDKTISSFSEAAGTVGLLLRLSKATTQTVTVNYSVSGTATSGVDYAALPGSARFNPGETTKTISLRIINDTLDEPDETVIVTLTGVIGAAFGATKVHTLTIQDNDPPPVVGFAQATGRVPENIGLARIAVRLSAPSGKTAKVNYATANGTALAGQDFLTTSGILTFAPGQTAATLNVRILPNGDKKPETMRINLPNPQNATLGASVHTLTIDRETALRRWLLYN